MSESKPLEEVIRDVKPELHAGMDQVKAIIERYLRLAFNPEESPTKLLIIGSVVLRIGVKMILGACREFYQSEDEGYKTISDFIAKWREHDKRIRAEAKGEVIPNV